ncbi:MAG: AAA family ATPase [Actinobacteria bacterium]|nr:AAA family ATPase [Actinomycetota bacterium]
MEKLPQSPKLWKITEVRREHPAGARLVCVANQKGGVGKTTTAINLAAGLALRGHSVLLVDIDPQANATTGLGIDHRALRRSTYDLIVGRASLEDIIRPTEIQGLDCLPATQDLAGAEIELVKQMARERKLRTVLAGVHQRYDVVFLDCPPSLGLLTVNGLIAARDLIVPVQCEYYALEGLGHLLRTAERVRGSLNPDLRIAGLLLTMYDARTKLSSQVATEVRSHFGRLVFNTVIPRSVSLSEAPSFGEPVLTLQPTSRGSISYRLLAAEFEARFGLDARRPAPSPADKALTGPDPQPVGAGSRGAVGRRPEPGPGGRGYGTVSPQPRALEEAFPPPDPWRGGW